jgi:hypothetical protein
MGFGIGVSYVQINCIPEQVVQLPLALGSLSIEQGEPQSMNIRLTERIMKVPK